MKAITLTQPWAQLVALGAKRIETRSWSTKYRGPLAIHAAKGFPDWAIETCYQPYFVDVLRKHYEAEIASQLPRGMIIATCELVHVVKIDEAISFPACSGIGWNKRLWQLNKQERAFGDYSVGRYAWLLENVVRLPEPIPAKGALSLWEWDPNTLTPTLPRRERGNSPGRAE